jgi:hypothetical protein
MACYRNSFALTFVEDSDSEWKNYLRKPNIHLFLDLYLTLLNYFSIRCCRHSSGIIRNRVALPRKQHPSSPGSSTWKSQGYANGRDLTEILSRHLSAWAKEHHKNLS